MLVDGASGTKTWVPTFPKARYLMGRVEFAHWRANHERPDMEAVFADSVKPVHDAGLVDLVETEHRITNEISLIPTIGHTPGHVSVAIESEGQHAVITGDITHHPCQLAHPEWTTSFDSDKETATATRTQLFAEWADRPILVIGTTMPRRQLDA